MKKYFNQSILHISLVFSLALFAQSCTKSMNFSEQYDINWPVPIIKTISPLKDTIGKTITITGEYFDKLTKVTVGNPETEAIVKSATATQIVVTIPRNLNSGAVTVYTNYKQKGISSQVFTPIFLDVTVNNWPRKITRGEPIVIGGSNMDMVTEVEIGGSKVTVPAQSGASSSQITIPTIGLVLTDQVTIKITKAKAGINNGTSNLIAVENPSNFFKPEAPIVLFDFESGTNPFVLYSGKTATSGINTSGASKGRGAKYFSLQMPGAVAWDGIGEMSYTSAIDLNAFHKPHLTFLVNTRGKDGYMQVEILQGGTKWGMHFKGGNSNFDYNLKTNGWTWVSVELKTDNVEKWGGSGTSFDPKGAIDAINLGFKRGNGDNNDFEINVDQIMITDGPQKPVFNAWDFEDGVNPYSGNAINGINQSGIATISGDKYLTVGLANAANWNWTGEIYKSGPIDLNNVNNAYINFWVNTNGKDGFFQFETTQSDVKWGGNLDASDYKVKTTGWKLYSLRLADIGWSKWGGSGTSTGLDPKGKLDYIKLGFSTGNVAGAYEVNIDDIFISDGPMF